MDLQLVNTVINMMRLERVETDLASPNYVADFAHNRGIKLTSAEVVRISDLYDIKGPVKPRLKITILKVGYQYGSLNKHIVYTNGLGDVRKVVISNGKPILVLSAVACKSTIKHFKGAVYA